MRRLRELGPDCIYRMDGTIATITASTSISSDWIYRQEKLINSLEQFASNLRWRCWMRHRIRPKKKKKQNNNIMWNFDGFLGKFQLFAVSINIVALISRPNSTPNAAVLSRVNRSAEKHKPNKKVKCSRTHPKKGQWNVNSKVSLYRVVKTMHKLYNKNLFNVSLVSMTFSVGFLLHLNPTTKLMAYKMYWMRERELCLGSLIMNYGRKCVSRVLSCGEKPKCKLFTTHSQWKTAIMIMMMISRWHGGSSL